MGVGGRMSTIQLYRGPDPLEGLEVAVLATLKGNNPKTGDMVQVRIVRPGDTAACPGECPLHPSNGGGCYARSGRPAMATGWFARRLEGEGAPIPQGELPFGAAVRLGADGDPAFIPLDVLARMLEHASSWTGYTHAWRRPEAQVYRGLLMASVESREDAETAWAMGWRTFRVTKTAADVGRGEVVCPHYVRGVQCADCGLCCGSSLEAKSIVHPAHGGSVKRALRVVF